MMDPSIKKLKYKPTYVIEPWAGAYYLRRYTRTSKSTIFASRGTQVLETMKHDLDKEATEYFQAMHKQN